MCNHGDDCRSPLPRTSVLPMPRGTLVRLHATPSKTLF